jgi:hypothetical protein
MATGPGGSKAYTFFLESPDDRPSPDVPTGPGAGGVPPLNPSAYDNYPVQEVHPSEKPQPGHPLEPNPFFTNVTPNPYRIVEACVATRREEERERLPTRVGGDEAWDRYHGRYDFSAKEDWQSQKVSPKLAISVERLVATLSRIRENSKDWFEVEAIDERVQIYYNFVKRLIAFYMDHDEVNFNRIFRHCIKSGLLFQMMYVLVSWETDGEVDVESAPEDQIGAPNTSMFSLASTEGFEAIMGGPGGEADPIEGVPFLPGTKRPKLRLEALNPDYVYLDATGRNRFVIWEMRYSKGEARREGDVRGWDPAALERALANPITTDDTTDTLAGFHEARDAAKQDRVPDYKAYSKMKITNYFGDLYDPNTGDLLIENSYFIVANDKELVYGPVENPFWDGGKPVVSSPLIEIPFAAYGRSPIVWNMDMFDLWNEYLNLLVDYMQSVLLGMKEVDMDLLEDGDEDLRDGIYPGKMIKTSKGSVPNLQAILNVPFSDVPQGFWQHMQILQKELSDNVLLSDSIGGADRTRGRITAMEFNRRAADAGSMIDFLFSAVEDNLLAPIIRLSFYRILQFMPQKMWAEWIDTHKASIEPKEPQLKAQWDQLAQDMKSWVPSQRFEKLGGFFKFRVRVFSALGDRQMEKGTFLMQTAAQIPGAAQYIKWDKMLRYIVRAFGWDPEEIISAQAIPLPMAAMQGTGTAPDLMSMLGQTGAETGEGGPSIGAPTNISTGPPFAPDSDGAPGPTGPRAPL